MRPFFNDKKLFRIAFIFISLIPCILISGPLSGQVVVKDLSERTSLAGQWKFMYGDDARYADPSYSDADWEDLAMPASIVRNLFDEKIKQVKLEDVSIGGVIWLRREVFVDKGCDRGPLGLILGRIGSGDETFFNGVKIGGMGKFPPDEFSMWNYPRHYLVPENLVRYGQKNVIAVRVSYYVYCEMLGTLAVTNFSDWNFDRVSQFFIRITLNYIIIFMGIPLFLMFFLFYIQRREQEYLYYFLQLFCGLFIVLDTCDFYIWDLGIWNYFGNTLFRFKVLAFSWSAINVVHPIFLHRIYDLKRKKIELALWIYLVSIFILLSTVTGVIGDYFQATIHIGLTLPIGFYNLSCHISALIKRSPYSKLFSFFGITVVLGAMHDGLVYFPKFGGLPISIFGYKPESMLFGYSAAALYIGTALVFIQRFINSRQEVDDLNITLENFVIENALLHEKVKSSQDKSYPVITEKGEEKIKRVMDYINENYTSDISREGLAASVDVHPDNLGKLFKNYTNKKLGDYIYELRIRDAAKKLAETDDNIIDIAFSVGFESLRTFNRVFPKFMRTTPEKFRKLVRQRK